MLTNLLLAAGIGSVMGLLNHIKRNKTVKKPRNTKRTWDPGFITDVAYGAIAAVAVVIVADPNGLERVILTSILGGYAGEGAIAKLEASNQQNNYESFKGNLDAINKELPAPKDEKDTKNDNNQSDKKEQK